MTGSPVAAGINPQSVVVDPSGRFLYVTSTKYTGGYTGFAQILGYSIDASNGSLTPLAGALWTDSAQSTGGALFISSGPQTVTNPVPMISSLSPSSAVAAGTGFTLQVNGANFVPGATVYFGGKPRTTTFVDSTQLTAAIPASDIDNGGTAVIFVFNPLPGGGASTSVAFPVSNPVPVISFLNPANIAAGTPHFTLVVVGSNFVTSSIVNFSGTPLATSYGASFAVSAPVPQQDIAATGSASITVTNPSNGVPGGGTSNAVTLVIVPPQTRPAVTSISPTSAVAGGPDFTLTVNGSGFVQGSQVTFNLNNVATTFVSATQLTALIPASAIAISGNPPVIVNNPNGFASTAISFTVTNPSPSGKGVSPPQPSSRQQRARIEYYRHRIYSELHGTRERQRSGHHL